MRRTLIALLLTALTACGGGGTPTGPSNPGGGSNVFSASIDGTAWSAPSASVNAAASTSSVPGGLIFTGTTVGTQARSLIISLDRIKGPGTYPLGVNTGTTAGGTLTMTLGSQSWWTPLNGKAGTITITSLTSTRVAGTFSGELGPLAGGAGTVHITNGKFDVPRNPGYAAPATDDEGSWVSATVGGFDWNGATVVGFGGGTGTAVVTATTDDYIVTITAGPLSGADSGPLTGAGAVPIRTVRVQRAGTTNAWGGLAGDVGTLSISSITAKRIAGTFSGTLAPLGGTPTPLAVIGGQFDVRIGQ